MQASGKGECIMCEVWCSPLEKSSPVVSCVDYTVVWCNASGWKRRMYYIWCSPLEKASPGVLCCIICIVCCIMCVVWWVVQCKRLEKASPGVEVTR